MPSETDRLLALIRRYLGVAGETPDSLEGLVEAARREGVAGLVGYVVASAPDLAALPGASELLQEHVQEFSRGAARATGLAEQAQGDSIQDPLEQEPRKPGNREIASRLRRNFAYCHPPS